MTPPPPLRLTAAARARLRDAAERREGGFVLEGRKLVADALARPGLRLLELWLADDLPADAAAALADAAAARGVAVGRAPARDLERVSDVVTPQGVLGLAEDPARPVDAVVGPDGLGVLLDGVQDPGNVGAVLRSAAAFGFVGALVGAGCADPVGAKALRASAGAALALPFARGPGPALVGAAAAAGATVWLLDADGDPLFALDARPARLWLAVGSEGRGAGPEVRAAASRRVAVPIQAVESLNAAVAFGIAAAHLARLPAARGGPGPTVPAPRPPRGGRP